MMIDYRVMENWVRHFGLQFHKEHASGHMSSEELAWLVGEVGAKVVIPVHTESPEEFRRLGGEVRIPVCGKRMRV